MNDDDLLAHRARELEKKIALLLHGEHRSAAVVALVNVFVGSLVVCHPVFKTLPNDERLAEVRLRVQLFAQAEIKRVYEERRRLAESN